MLKMIKGVKINDADKLNEEYMIENNYIISNINEDKILDLILEFIDIQKESLFLIIEVPTSKDKEKAEGEFINQLHKDVYYLDNMPISFAKEILGIFGNLFINDGMAQIGIGNHVTNAEIMKEKYNVVTIFNGKDNIERYTSLLNKKNIKQVEKITTAWDYFNNDNLGECNIIEEDGKTIYDTINILTKESGLYFAERRKD